MPAMSLQIHPDLCGRRGPGGLPHQPHLQMGKLSPGGDRTGPVRSWDRDGGAKSLTGVGCCPAGQLMTGPPPRRLWEEGLARAPSR